MRVFDTSKLQRYRELQTLWECQCHSTGQPLKDVNERKNGRNLLITVVLDEHNKP